eukprot:UN32169
MQPQIRYRAGGPNRLCKELKDHVEQAFLKGHKTMSIMKMSDVHPVLLILDRSADPLTPLMHELHYQAMLMDYCDVEKLTVNTGKKKYKLTDKDPIWVDSRYLHIGEVSQSLPKRLQHFKKNNAAMKYHEAKKKE